MMIAALKVNKANQLVVMQELKKGFPDDLRSVAILKYTEEEGHWPCWNINLKCVDHITDSSGIPDDVKEDVNMRAGGLGFEANDFWLVQIFLPTSVKNALQFNLRPKAREWSSTGMDGPKNDLGYGME